MIVAGIAAGALWAGIAGLLRMTVKVNEAVTHAAAQLHRARPPALPDLRTRGRRSTAGPARDARARRRRQAALHRRHRGPRRPRHRAGRRGRRCGSCCKYTTWGFRLAVVGGNPEAARRAGLAGRVLLLSALLVGGALAGLAGMVHFAGVEYKLRAGVRRSTSATSASSRAGWPGTSPLPGRSSPRFAFAAIIVAGDSLQLDSGLPAATVNVLTGLILHRGPRVDRPGKRTSAAHAGGLMSLIVDVLTGGVRGGTSITVRRARRDRLRAGGRHQPRHRGLHARRCARRLRDRRRDWEPLDRGARRCDRRRRCSR